MIFDNNIPYQTYRVLIAIFGTLGMIVATVSYTHLTLPTKA